MQITSEDAKTIGIIGGLFVSSIALTLNFYSTIRSIKSQKIANYQEIIKSHRDLWKLCLSDRDDLCICKRIFDLRVNLKESPITDKERLFTRLLFLHMSSAYSFAKYSHMLPSKKLRGAQIPIPAASGRGITEFALRDALPLCS